MSAHLELAQAVELHRAELRWLDHCAARLRLADAQRRGRQTAQTAQTAPTPDTMETAR